MKKEKAKKKEEKQKEDGGEKGMAAQEKPPAPTQEQLEMNAKVKEIEDAFFAIRFFPVAVDEKSMREAVAKITEMHGAGNDTIKQLVLYMAHENISKYSEFKLVHTYEYLKARNPNEEPSKLRIGVYRAMFNYNTSLEGIFELVRMLGSLNGDDAAKVLTYHFSRISTIENEGNHMMRASIIEALGKSDSKYALTTLLDYAKYSDSERSMRRIVSALMEWKEKIEKMEITSEEKAELLSRLKEVMTRETGGSHYG